MFQFIGKIFRSIGNFITSAFIAVAVVATASAEVIQRSGEAKTCSNGYTYAVNFKANSFEDTHFITLENKDLGIVNVLRDVDKTRMIIEFSGTKYIEKFIDILDEPPLTKFIIDGLDIRRYFSHLQPISNSLEITTAQAKYDEVFESANISLNTYQGCDEIDVPFCLGVNTDKSCSASAGPIPLYNNPKLGLTVTCSNCFTGFYADVFFDMKIRFFKLESLSGGFRNMAVTGAIVTDTRGSYSWSVGIDKTLQLVKPTTIIIFHIGPVPIRLWFEIPVEEKMDISVKAGGEVEVGATGKWKLGDNYMSWDVNKHWVHHTSAPVFTWSPVLKVSGYLDAESSASLSPTVILHVDNIYTMWLTLIPTLYASVTGSVKDRKVCAKASYEVEAIFKAEISINIPIIHKGYEHVWGPERIWDMSSPIGEICVKV